MTTGASGSQPRQLLERRNAHIPGYDDIRECRAEELAGKGGDGRLPFGAGDADDRGGTGTEEETHLHLDRDIVRAARAPAAMRAAAHPDCGR